MMVRAANHTKYFLAGGGGAADSELLDRAFIENVRPGAPILFVPHAKRPERRHAAWTWFRDAMSNLGADRAELVSLSAPPAMADVGGIYVGGGDTGNLLDEVRACRFDRYLMAAAAQGVPIYGGSAGAIILGKDIRTAPEARTRAPSQARGLNLLGGLSVICHFEHTTDSSHQTFLEPESVILAIPENAGVIISKSELTNVGTGSVILFERHKARIISAGRTSRIPR